MDKLRVRTYRDDLCSDRLEFLMLLCQSSKLGCSDKSKICRIKE
jgi:hypothetical protein